MNWQFEWAVTARSAEEIPVAIVLNGQREALSHLGAVAILWVCAAVAPERGESNDFDTFVGQQVASLTADERKALMRMLRRNLERVPPPGKYPIHDGIVRDDLS